MAYYDPNKDYSAALSNPNLSAAERAQLTSERQAKINDMYGGVEPNYGNTGQTFSSLYGANGSGISGGSGGSSGGGSGGGQTYAPYSGSGTGFGFDSNPNFDYSNLLGQLMNIGSDNYDYMAALLNERTNKALGTEGLGKYANDAFAQQVRDYIAQGRQTQQNASLAQMQQYYQSMLDSLASAYTMPTYPPSQWDTTKDALAKAALDMNYDDWTKSDQYASLAERYGHNGQLSMQDLLGQIASRTGGMASSYATTAAQQQYNEYMAQLEEAARAAFANERNDAIGNAQLAYEFADSDYQRYLDQLSQANNDRSFAFDVLSQALAQSNYANEWQRTLDRDAISDRRYDDETAWERSNYSSQTEYNQALAKAETLATAGDFSGYKALGYSDEEIANLRAKYDSDQAAAKAKASASKSSSGNGAKSTQSAQYSNVRKQAMSYKDIDQAADYLNRMVDGGYITEDEASDIYLVDLGGGTEPTVTASAPTSYSEFVQRTGNSAIMTEREFARARNSARTAGYSDYQDYLAKMWEKYGN